MANASFNKSVRIPAREFLGIGGGGWVRRTVCITFECNGGYSDKRPGSKSLFHFIVFRLALHQAEPPTVVVNHDADMVWVIEGGCTTLESGIVEIPLRRSALPGEFGKVVPVFIVACSA